MKSCFLKKIIFFTLTSFLVLSIAGCSSNNSIRSKSTAKINKITVKFSHVVAENTPKGQAALKFKELLEKSGQFEVQVYPSSRLYGDQEELAALKADNVQLIAPSAAKLTGLNPSFQLVDLPFLFKDEQAAYDFYDGQYGQKLMNSLKPQGIIGLTWWPSGFKNFTDSIRPLMKPEDFNGLKFRTQSGGVLEDQFKCLAAGSQTMAFGDVYQALARGTVDGQENTFNNIDTQKYEEVQKYMTISSHARIDYVLLTNTKFWDSLTPEQQNVFEEAMKEATAYERTLADGLNEKSYENLKNSGKLEIYTLTDADRRAFEKKLKPIYDKYTDIIGKDYIDAARNSK